MTSDELITALRTAFEYTSDNNPDIVEDPTFTIGEVAEELMVASAYQFLVAYIARNRDVIDYNLKEGKED